MLKRSTLGYLIAVTALLIPHAQAVDLANLDSHTLPSTLTTDEVPAQPISFETTRKTSLLDAIHQYEQWVNLPWEKLPNGRSLHAGETAAIVPLVRDRLRLLGDLKSVEATPDSDQFDSELETALKRFQARHGLEPDGILGRKTRMALNVSPTERLQQLEVNLLRQEQFSRITTPLYVQVNIPEYRLRVLNQDQVALEMKTIVGRKSRKTPVFSSEIDTMVVNPSWYVPKSIAFKDILPKQQANPEYMAQHNLKVITGWGNGIQEIPLDQVDWNSLYTSPQAPRLWEPPSDGNTLGQVKFLTPNRYAVYLHDTSAKALFNKPDRAFSSGCIRVEQPRLLADLLMSLSNQWAPEQVNSLFESTDTQRINLARPIPLHITYWTAWIDNEQQLQFREDIYRRDKTDLSALQIDNQSAQISSN
ncbi:L,D-transpeptidase family protein [Neptuniibacter sp. CAU 1671]|uniref:L,D-transpeptidase family protein n=1 Tax=Neptuniibacter sp. CAU 1671 TaxID=3032593 RepID=UPI0023DC5513|nr:L,D-transpeptidase family protein [Neptuniibacter sp. CAU 1671]MDF2180814.1 L,D-transpeptidase family protein [Neptuniibacter sp. CAU 1671]